MRKVVIKDGEIVHVFTSASRRFDVTVGDGTVAIQDTHGGDLSWLAPGYSVQTCVIAPKPDNTHELAQPGPLGEPTMVDGVPTVTREWMPPSSQVVARDLIDKAAAAASNGEGVTYTLPAGSLIYDGAMGGLGESRDGEGVEIHIDLINPIMGREYWIENTAKWQTMSEAEKPERMRYQAWLNGDGKTYIRFEVLAADVTALLAHISSVSSPKTTSWMDLETLFLNEQYDVIIAALGGAN